MKFVRLWKQELLLCVTDSNFLHIRYLVNIDLQGYNISDSVLPIVLQDKPRKLMHKMRCQLANFDIFYQLGPSTIVHGLS